MHVAIITAGGAGMFCGSCMHDNTWAQALRAAGCEVTLIPTYTPIRVDEEDQTDGRVYLGGINLYLEHRLPFWRRIPRGLVRWLDAPSVLNLTRFASNNARKLGPLTLAMLDGERGPQQREIGELVDFIAGRLRPDVVVFSNALLVGVLRRLRQQFAGLILCTLQGDDIFLEALPEPYRGRAIEQIHERALEFDGFLVHSRYYRDFMAAYLNLPLDKFDQIPLGIDLRAQTGLPKSQPGTPFTVGYFARICAAKGLHRLVDAFRIVHRRRRGAAIRLVAGGYLGRSERPYLHDVRRAARELGPAFRYAGSPASHPEKVRLISRFDVLSVPTDYHEPKGIYVLEAMANGVPVVQPRHGAFPELIETTGGGLLVEPGNSEDLAARLEEAADDHTLRHQLASTGHRRVHELYGPRMMAARTLEVFERRRRPVQRASP